MNPTVLAACIGAVAAVAAAFVGFRLGDKQNELERRKFLSDLIVKVSALGSEEAKGTAAQLFRSNILDKEEAEMLCRIFRANCTPVPAKK